MRPNPKFIGMECLGNDSGDPYIVIGFSTVEKYPFIVINNRGSCWMAAIQGTEHVHIGVLIT